ncbi:GMP/IMP nucleotidase [Thalassotalea sp. 1_MG-2023]|uniref:GMP/IMP nucleotidase n=1 Tax=Thalassotalea sp. 1_MG-2023 TaxID=3062680 RepID=UPI0026E2B38A|nr:GMP/IMP nucleotidase [Thalassotalea sp. 1_MG-2023]MDO6425713.1 GMP/IMP nucleotidase [Thalassotalea sp. 1_MG-2023]
MIDWSKISTVLLDMDGTILDLHYDNHFWLTHLPKRISEQQNISVEEATNSMLAHYEKVSGTLSWYCIDYWAEQTNMPINELKREVQHLINLREDAHDFLTALKQTGREVILVTNAHPDSLALKIERTQLDRYFDTLYSTHEFGVTKESQSLWQKLQAKQDFDVNTTLFVDDSLPILTSAQTFGIKHILAVANPDSKLPVKNIVEFPAVSDYRTMLSDIYDNPVVR